MSGGKGGGCLTIIAGLFVVGLVVQGCESLFGVHDDSDRITAAHEAVEQKVSGSFCENDKVTHLTDTDEYLVTGCIQDNTGNDYYRVTEDSDTTVSQVELSSQ